MTRTCPADSNGIGMITSIWTLSILMVSLHFNNQNHSNLFIYIYYNFVLEILHIDIELYSNLG